MPRWPDTLSASVIFLYYSRDDAEAGESDGGSGFLLGLPWESEPKRNHIYAVSNYHVAKRGASVIRLNSKGGGTSCIETDPSEWFHIPGRDLAVYRVGDADLQGASFKYTDFNEIELTQEIWDQYGLGIGDEVVSLGRFVDLKGTQQNEPLLRTGILASGNILPINQPAGMPWQVEPSYIVEMRSRTGFSGSLVMIYFDRWATRMVETEANTKAALFYGPWLLGVQWGQMPIKGPDATDPHGASTSMLAVVPCQALSELLKENEKVIEERRAHEARHNSAHECPKQAEAPTKIEDPIERTRREKQANSD